MMKIISHDFRSPLISIGNTLQLIPNLIEEDDLEAVKRLSKKDSDSVSRVLSLIDSLISWTLSQTEDIPFNPKKYNLKQKIKLKVPCTCVCTIIKPQEHYRHSQVKKKLKKMKKDKK